MAEADLTAARLRELLHYDPDTGVFTNLVTRNNNSAIAGDTAGTLSHGYIQIRIEGTIFKAHRLAFLYMNGSFPLGYVDHINRVRNDNRWCNLRDVTNSFNMQNVVRCNRNNVTGRRGVMPHGSGFRAQIMLNGKTTSLGTYRTIEDAAKAYEAAKAVIHAGAVSIDSRQEPLGPSESIS